MTDDKDSREDRRWRYNLVLSAIGHNTGDPHPPLVDATALFTTTVANGPLDADAARTALQAAVDNKDAIRWHVPDGGIRYGVTDSGLERASSVSRPLLPPADEPALRDIIKREAATDDPDREVIAWCNKRLAALGES